MSAKLFFLPYSTATVNGIAQPGAQLFFYQTGTLTKLPIYTTDLLDVQLTNPVTATGAGRFPDIYLDSTQTYRLIVKDRLGATLDDIDPYVPGTVVGLVTETTFVTPQQFGAIADGVTDDSNAFVQAIAYLKSIANDSAWILKGSRRLFVPAGTYNMGTTTLDITHTLIIEGDSGFNGWGSRLKWTGDCEGIRVQEYNTSGTATVDGVTHFTGRNSIIRNLSLCGPYEDQTDFTGHTEGEYHAIRVKAQIIIEDVFIDGWAGDGVHALTSIGGGGAEEGSSNVSFINRLRVTNVRNGLYIDGADANAWTTIGVYGTYCRQHTIYDSSFLGNCHIGPHSASAGLVPGVAPCIVSRGGSQYGVIQGQAAGASTNAPQSSIVTITIASPGVVTWNAHGLGAGMQVAFSTTGALPTGLVANTTYYVVSATANTFQVAATVGGAAINTSGSQSGVHTASAGIDNTWWLYMGAGAANSAQNIGAWVNATTYREGGGFRTDSANAANLFLNPYQEGSECPSQYVCPTLVMGGLTGGNREILTTGNHILGGKIDAPSPSGNKFHATTIYRNSNTLPQQIIHNNAATAAGAFARTDYCQGFEADGTTPMGVARIQVWPSSSSPATAEGVMYFGTRTFGGAGAFTDQLELNGSGPRLAPLTDNVVDSGKSTSRWKTVLAYTGDFKAGLTSSSATAGVGYATGAGGAVTQLTSRTTGVTLNTICGAITLFSAAGTATWQTFTVTNSAVAATDVVRVVQKSGTDLNMIHVTNVAAGSFKVSFATTGGTTVEQPVFNFAVIKAVAA